jgi:hypothetical protein
MFLFGDDRYSRKSLGVGGIPLNVIVMPVCIEQISYGLVGPLANLGDVFACAGRQITGIHHEHPAVAGDDHSIALREMIRRILVPDFVNALGQLRNRTVFAARRIRLQKQRGDQPNRQNCCAEPNHGRVEPSANK